MRAFMDKDFLLENETAKTLFHNPKVLQLIHSVKHLCIMIFIAANLLRKMETDCDF